MNVARNVIKDPRLVPGGGACEMALAHVSLGSVFFSSLVHVIALHHSTNTFLFLMQPSC